MHKEFYKPTRLVADFSNEIVKRVNENVKIVWGNLELGVCGTQSDHHNIPQITSLGLKTLIGNVPVGLRQGILSPDFG